MICKAKQITRRNIEEWRPASESLVLTSEPRPTHVPRAVTRAKGRRAQAPAPTARHRLAHPLGVSRERAKLPSLLLHLPRAAGAADRARAEWAAPTVAAATAVAAPRAGARIRARLG